METKFRKYTVVMILCFLLGGFSIILYAMQAYLAFSGLEFYGSFREFRSSFPEIVEGRNLSNQTMGQDRMNRSFSTRPATPNPTTFILSPYSLMLLFVGLVSLVSGISIHNLTREKEIDQTKNTLTSALLTPDEKIVFDEIKKARGEITQSNLVIKTGLSKVKVHRIVLRMEVKGIVKKHRYGLTNKIIMEKNM